MVTYVNTISYVKDDYVKVHTPSLNFNKFYSCQLFTMYIRNILADFVSHRVYYYSMYLRSHALA